MARLEYRLFDESKNFPLRYYYDNIDATEIAIRFVCDYFIKDGITYEKTSCAAETPTYKIYVQEAQQQDWLENSPPIKTSNKLRVELRQYVENAAYFPLIHVFEMTNNIEMLLFLQSDYVYWLGQEWQKTSAEIDEDSKIYVYYAEQTSGGLQHG